MRIIFINTTLMNLIKIKNQIDYWLAVWYDCSIAKKGVFVVGYTKSGTNWLRNLIRQYYNIDNDNDKDFFRIRVHHLHRFVSNSYFKKKSIYMIRDGRDTIVSRYFTMIRQVSQSKMKTDFITYCGIEPTQENIVELLPSYIQFLEKYHKSSIDYRSHVLKAEQLELFIIKYEDLHKDTVNTFKRVLNFLDNKADYNEERILKVIEESSFEASVKKKKIQTGFFREDGGKSGGWKKYFNKESARLFQQYAGDILIKYSYEKNDDWVNEFTE